MRKSIGKKVLGLLGLLGFLLVLICLLNLAALKNVEKYNKQMAQTFEEYNQIIQTGDADQIQETLKAYEYVVQRSDIRVSGTEVFDVILIIAILIFMVICVIAVKRTIANPAKDASRQLTTIVEKIQQSHGDLTERIRTKSVDEIGQLVFGINGFIEQLQKVIKQLKEESTKIMYSVNEVNDQVEASNERANNLSEITEKLAYSMEKVANTVEQLVRGSEA
ncbi:MAG: HAMP domain-containing protein, partial [Lachnospiraceae bacterium]